MTVAVSDVIDPAGGEIAGGAGTGGGAAVDAIADDPAGIVR